MAFKAGFAQIDITPPLGTQKAGWLKVIVSDKVLDPLYCHCAAFSSGEAKVGFVQLDTLSVRWTTARQIRDRITKTIGFPGDNVLVSATHNHAGPAVANCGAARRDDAYLAAMVDKAVSAFGDAAARMEDAEVGANHVYEWNVAFNRRVVMRDGLARTHGNFKDPDALYVEGPIDPEVAVVAARSKRTGKVLGALYNFACHPTHHGGETTLSAGFPGVAADELKKLGVPVALFLNGACGNTHHSDPRGLVGNDTKERAGKILASDVAKAIGGMEFSADASVGAGTARLDLPYRSVTEAEIRGTIPGAQRFIDPKLYDEGMPRLLERIRTRKVQPVELVGIRVGEAFFVSIPAEYFVEFGLRIKENSAPRGALVVATANGCIGYVPTPEGFRRGGYETTFAASSRMAPEAGDMLADAAVKLIRQLP